jgi:hypothetical protein
MAFPPLILHFAKLIWEYRYIHAILNPNTREGITLNCSKCGKEITESRNGLCPECSTTQNCTYLITNAGLLTTIAAVFALTLAIVSLISYQSYVEYYSYYGYPTTNGIGFFAIAGIAIAATALGFLSASFAFQKKRFILAITGPVLIAVSGIIVFVIEIIFALGLSDGFTVPAVPAIALSIVGLVMLFKSKQAFTDYNVCPIEPELPEPSA